MDSLFMTNVLSWAQASAGLDERASLQSLYSLKILPALLLRSLPLPESLGSMVLELAQGGYSVSFRAYQAECMRLGIVEALVEGDLDQGHARALHHVAALHRLARWRAAAEGKAGGTPGDAGAALPLPVSAAALHCARQSWRSGTGRCVWPFHLRLGPRGVASAHGAGCGMASTVAAAQAYYAAAADRLVTWSLPSDTPASVARFVEGGEWRPLTYAEHCALHSGSMAGLPAPALRRLWRFLLRVEPSAFGRRLFQALKGAGEYQPPPPERRALVTALLRRGVPSELRGWWWGAAAGVTAPPSAYPRHLAAAARHLREWGSEGDATAPPPALRKAVAQIANDLRRTVQHLLPVTLLSCHVTASAARPGDAAPPRLAVDVRCAAGRACLDRCLHSHPPALRPCDVLPESLLQQDFTGRGGGQDGPTAPSSAESLGWAEREVGGRHRLTGEACEALDLPALPEGGGLAYYASGPSLAFLGDIAQTAASGAPGSPPPPLAPGQEGVLTVSVQPSLRALWRVLLAVTQAAPEVGYCQGMNFMAAHALRWMGEAEAAALLARVVTGLRPGRGQYYASMAPAAADLAVLTAYVSEGCPRLLQHAGALPMAPPDREMVLQSLCGGHLRWLLCLYATPFPPAFTSRLWDLYFSQGPKVLFTLALALLRLATPWLLLHTRTFPDLVAALEGLGPAVVAALAAEGEGPGEGLQAPGLPLDTPAQLGACGSGEPPPSPWRFPVLPLGAAETVDWAVAITRTSVHLRSVKEGQERSARYTLDAHPITGGAPITLLTLLFEGLQLPHTTLAPCVAGGGVPAAAPPSPPDPPGPRPLPALHAFAEEVGGCLPTTPPVFHGQQAGGALAVALLGWVQLQGWGGHVMGEVGEGGGAVPPPPPLWASVDTAELLRLPGCAWVQGEASALHHLPAMQSTVGGGGGVCTGPPRLWRPHVWVMAPTLAHVLRFALPPLLRGSVCDAMVDCILGTGSEAAGGAAASPPQHSLAQATAATTASLGGGWWAAGDASAAAGLSAALQQQGQAATRAVSAAPLMRPRVARHHATSGRGHAARIDAARAKRAMAAFHAGVAAAEAAGAGGGVAPGGSTGGAQGTAAPGPTSRLAGPTRESDVTRAALLHQLHRPGEADKAWHLLRSMSGAFRHAGGGDTTLRAGGSVYALLRGLWSALVQRQPLQVTVGGEGEGGSPPATPPAGLCLRPPPSPASPPPSTPEPWPEVLLVAVSSLTNGDLAAAVEVGEVSPAPAALLTHSSPAALDSLSAEGTSGLAAPLPEGLSALLGLHVKGGAVARLPTSPLGSPRVASSPLAGSPAYRRGGDSHTFLLPAVTVLPLTQLAATFAPNRGDRVIHAKGDLLATLATWWPGAASGRGQETGGLPVPSQGGASRPVPPRNMVVAVGGSGDASGSTPPYTPSSLSLTSHMATLQGQANGPSPPPHLQHAARGHATAHLDVVTSSVSQPADHATVAAPALWRIISASHAAQAAPYPLRRLLPPGTQSKVHLRMDGGTVLLGPPDTAPELTPPTPPPAAQRTPRRSWVDHLGLGRLFSSGKPPAPSTPAGAETGGGATSPASTGDEAGHAQGTGEHCRLGQVPTLCGEGQLAFAVALRVSQPLLRLPSAAPPIGPTLVAALARPMSVTVTLPVPLAACTPQWMDTAEADQAQATVWGVWALFPSQAWLVGAWSALAAPPPAVVPATGHTGTVGISQAQLDAQATAAPHMHSLSRRGRRSITAGGPVGAAAVVGTSGSAGRATDRAFPAPDDKSRLALVLPHLQAQGSAGLVDLEDWLVQGISLAALRRLHWASEAQAVWENPALRGSHASLPAFLEAVGAAAVDTLTPSERGLFDLHDADAAWVQQQQQAQVRVTSPDAAPSSRAAEDGETGTEEAPALSTTMEASDDEAGSVEEAASADEDDSAGQGGGSPAAGAPTPPAHGTLSPSSVPDSSPTEHTPRQGGLTRRRSRMTKLLRPASLRRHYASVQGRLPGQGPEAVPLLPTQRRVALWYTHGDAHAAGCPGWEQLQFKDCATRFSPELIEVYFRPGRATALSPRSRAGTSSSSPGSTPAQAAPVNRPGRAPSDAKTYSPHVYFRSVQQTRQEVGGATPTRHRAASQLAPRAPQGRSSALQKAASARTLLKPGHGASHTRATLADVLARRAGQAEHAWHGPASSVRNTPTKADVDAEHAADVKAAEEAGLHWAPHLVKASKDGFPVLPYPLALEAPFHCVHAALRAALMQDAAHAVLRHEECEAATLSTLPAQHAVPDAPEGRRERARPAVSSAHLDLARQLAEAAAAGETSSDEEVEEEPSEEAAPGSSHRSCTVSSTLAQRGDAPGLDEEASGGEEPSAAGPDASTPAADAAEVHLRRRKPPLHSQPSWATALLISMGGHMWTSYEVREDYFAP